MRLNGFLAVLCAALPSSTGCNSLPPHETAAELFTPSLFIRPGSSAVPSFAEAITIQKAVDIAMSNYPAIEAARARVDAASASVALANTAYLPASTSSGRRYGRPEQHLRRALPSVRHPLHLGSGLEHHIGDNAWGSAAGALLSYEPFDFGLRGATVDVARAPRSTREPRPRSPARGGDQAAESFSPWWRPRNRPSSRGKRRQEEGLRPVGTRARGPGAPSGCRRVARRSAARAGPDPVDPCPANAADAQAALAEALGLPQGPSR